MWGYYPEGYQPASHQSIMLVSILIAFLGVLVAYVMHLKDRPRGERLAGQYPFATRLLEAKYWVDEVYQAGIVEPLRRLGRAFFVIDQYVVDGIIWVVSFIPQIFGFSLRLTTQRGYLQGYAVMMLLGVALILLVMFMS
jgi:NADH-quinone oxidoreductase subunit L